MKNFTLLCGHYGAGKTNLAINMAINESRKGKKIILSDFDLIDPYFRSSDYADKLDKYGIELISPAFSRTTLDLPVLPPNLYSIFSQDEKDVIIDTGGDEKGVKIVSRFFREIQKNGYKMYFVVNYYRLLLQSAERTIKLAKMIESNSRLKITGVINNSHLKEETTEQTILDSMESAKKIAKDLKVPLSMTTVSADMVSKLCGKVDNIYPIDSYMQSGFDYFA